MIPLLQVRNWTIHTIVVVFGQIVVFVSLFLPWLRTVDDGLSDERSAHYSLSMLLASLVVLVVFTVLNPARLQKTSLPLATVVGCALVMGNILLHYPTEQSFAANVIYGYWLGLMGAALSFVASLEYLRGTWLPIKKQNNNQRDKKSRNE